MKSLSLSSLAKVFLSVSLIVVSSLNTTVGAIGANPADGEIFRSTPPPVGTSIVDDCEDEIVSRLTLSGSDPLWGGGLVSVGESNTLSSSTYIGEEYSNKKTNVTTLSDIATSSPADYSLDALREVNNLDVAIECTSNIPTADLVGYYKFNGNANTESGDNDGTLHGNPQSIANRFGIANSAYNFNGSNQYVTTSRSYRNPSNFTLSLWFKTNTTSGGKLIGFGNNKTEISRVHDRHIYMNNAGQIYFGVYPNKTPTTINSTLSYNDNEWHNVTATLSSTAGMTLYIDGEIVASNASVTNAETTTGDKWSYWRIGGDNLKAWPSEPSSNFFRGILDDVIIYHQAISAAEVSTIYYSPDGAGNNGPACIGSTLQLTAKTSPGANYLWTGPNGFMSIEQNPTRIYSAAHAGVYKLQVTAPGCITTAYTTVKTSQTVGQWTGNVSTDWANPTNWCDGNVPTATTDVVIPGNATRQPTITSGVTSKNLTIEAGATLTTSTSGILNITGKLNNNGIFTSSGTTNFNGTSGQQTFSGVTQFNNVTISNTSGLILPSAITVNNLLLSKGPLNANNFNLAVKGNWTNNSAVASFIAGTSTTTFNGSVAQTIGGSFSTTYNNLAIASTDEVTLAKNISIVGNLTVATGTFNLSSYTANRNSAGGTLTVSNNAILKIGGTNTYPVNYATNTLVVASTVEYSGTNQTVANLLYGNLTLSSSTGAVVKTLPTTPLTVVGNFTSSLGMGTSVSFAARSNLTINGNVLIGASTVFNGGSFSHSVGANWVNNGQFNGNTSTLTFTGSGASVSGSGAQNFNNLTVAASAVDFAAGEINLSGNLATTGSGSFSQATGGTLFMAGAGKTIRGFGISLHNLTISGSVNTFEPMDLSGNLLVNGSLTTGAGILSMSGSSKTISGAGGINLGTLSVPGSVTTNANFTISSGLSVNGSFSASSGTATFTGTTYLSGTADLFNSSINGTALQLSANSTLGVAGTLTIASGTLDVTSSIPNTVNFNGESDQDINPITYSDLVLSNGYTKTAIGNITTTHDITIESNTNFNGSSYTHSISGDWTNRGTFAAGTGTVQFLGAATAYIIGATTFNTLSNNTSSATTELILEDNISADVVNMTQGIISTKSDTLTITGTRTGNGYIYGNIQRTHPFTTGVAYAFEGPENTIAFSTVSAVNSVIVSVRKGIVEDFPFGGSISRMYDIAVPTGTYSATLRLHYEDDELNGNNENTMETWNFNGSVWGAVGKTTNDDSANYVEQSGLSDITNRWTLSDNSNVVQWNGSVSSDWNTAANWTVLQGSASTPPLATDIVDLGTASFTNQPTISSQVKVKNIIFGGVQPVVLSLESGGSLTSGDINGIGNNYVSHTINANDQMLQINGDLSLSSAIGGPSIDLSLSSGTVNIVGALFQSGDADIKFNGTGMLNIFGDYNRNGGTFSAGSGTVTYNGPNNQTIADVSYNNLTINKVSGLASILEPTEVGGNLLIAAGGLDNLSTLHVLGNVDVQPGANLHNHVVMHVGGNWINNGTFSGEGLQAYIKFTGAGTQTISTTTFNNLEIDKPVGSEAILLGNIIVNGDVTVSSGTLNLSTFNFDGNVRRGTATLTDLGTLTIGANTPPLNFTNYIVSDSSTIIFDGTIPQILIFPEINIGNLILRNSGTKTLQSPLTVRGNLTIENGTSFDGNSFTISLNGNWIDNGTFIPSAGTVLFTGTSKTVAGNSTFYQGVFTGSYTILNDLTFERLLNITSSGSLSSDNSINTTLHGDLINSGTLNALGATTFSGDVVQTLSLINATTVAATVNFNGSVSPVLNSTSSPQFAILNINNTGGVNPSVDWTIFDRLTISEGASFNGGGSSHKFMGSLFNSGSITSEGTLNFIPPSPVTLNSGNYFSSTGTVIFGGEGAITLEGNSGTFADLIVSNTHGSGVSPSVDWTINKSIIVNSGSSIIAGNHTYTIGEDFINNGIIQSDTSTFILDGTVAQKVYTNSAFNNLTLNKASGSAILQTDATVNGVLNFVSGNIVTEEFILIQPSSGSIAGAADSTGWVNGNLQKNIATGSTEKNFEVGDGSYFTPISVAFENVTSSGTLTAKTISGDHPNLSESTFRSDRTVNRYWSFTNNDVNFTDATLSINWVPEDVDESAITENFQVGSFDNPNWMYTPVQDPLATSIQTTEITSLNDIAVGEACALTTTFSYPDSLFCSIGGTVTPIITGTAGIFSSTSGLSIDPITGVIDLDASTPGIYEVINSASSDGGCTSQSRTTISIGIIPEISVTTSETCEDESTGTITVSVTDGVPPYTYSLNAGAYQESNVFSGLAAGTYTLDVKGDAGCIVSTSVTVIAYSPSATIEYAESPYRNDQGIATAIQTGTPGGIYSSTAGLDINEATGDITLSSSATGTYIVTYTITSAVGCDPYLTSTSITIDEACGSDFTWLGINSNWFDPINWCGGQVPPPAGSTETIFIPFTANPPVIEGADVAVDGDISLDADTRLTIRSDNSFTLNPSSDVNADIASLIIIEEGASYRNLGAGVPRLQVHQEITGNKGWRMLGAPVITTYDDLLDSVVSQGFIGSDYPALQPNVMWWDERDKGTTLQGWRLPDGINNNVLAGRGYYVYIFDGATLPGLSTANYTDELPLSMDATGLERNLFNTGFAYDVTYTPRDSSLISSGDSALVEVNVADEGFNLLANPTPGTIDFFATGSWTKTNIDESIYVWDPHYNNGQGQFLTYNGTTGNLGTGLLAPFQGFWVRANNLNPSLSMTNSGKSAIPGDFIARKQMAAPLDIQLQLRGDGLMADSYISFSEKGREGPDPFDAYQMESLGDDWLLLYTYSSLKTKSPLVINHLPLLAEEERAIPLHIASSKGGAALSGKYNLQWELPKNWPSELTVVLMDHSQEKAIDMTKQNKYDFNFNAPMVAAEPRARIKHGLRLPKALIFQSPYETDDANKRVDTSKPKRPFTILVGGEYVGGLKYRPETPMLFAPVPNPFQSKVNIRFSLPTEEKAELRIFDMQGKEREVFPSTIYKAGIHTIEWNPDFIPPGVYLIYLRTEGRVDIQKLIKH